MITKMVIAIANTDIENHTAIEFLQIALYICTILKDEINNIQIAMPCSRIIAVIQPQQSHCGSKMNPFSIFGSVKTFRKQGVISFACCNNFCFRCIYTGFYSKKMAEMFPQSGIVIIFA